MEEVFSNDVYKELIMVLSFCENDIIDKIPDDLIESISYKAADSDKEYYFKKNKKLEEQDLSKECLQLLGILYYNYVASEEEKKEIIKSWQDDEEEIE